MRFIQEKYWFCNLQLHPTVRWTERKWERDINMCNKNKKNMCHSFSTARDVKEIETGPYKMHDYKIWRKMIKHVIVTKTYVETSALFLIKNT